MKELSHKIIKGSFWVLSLQVIQRSLALLRTLILARLLAPEEFGLFALASIMILAFEVFTRTGFEDALIHIRDDLESFLHTSYWIQVYRGIILAILCLLLAPLMGKIFHEPAVVKVAQFMALTQFVRGFRSIGIILLQRDLNFKKESYFNLIFVGVTFIATITLSFYFKNVLGMVYGLFAGELVATITSFLFHPYRPRFEFRLGKAAFLWNYGVWLFLAGIVSYLALNLDKIFIGHFLDTETLGIYFMAVYLANLPTTEFVKVVGRVTQPAYAKLQNDSVKLRQAFSLTLRYSILLVAPSAIGVALLSPKFTPLILGDKWESVALPLSLLVIGGLFRSVAGLGGAFFKATGKPKPILVLESVRAMSIGALLYFGYNLAGLVGIAAVSAISSLLILPISLYFVHKRVGGYFEWIHGFGKTILPVSIMALAVSLLIKITPGNWIVFLLIILTAFIIYGLAIIKIDKSIIPSIKSIYR